MNYKVIYGKNDLVYTGFLALPGKLYQKNELTQDYDTEYKTILDKGIMPSEKVLDFPVDCNTLTGSVNL